MTSTKRDLQITVSNPIMYVVRHQGEYAEISVQQGQSPGVNPTDIRGWVTVGIRSTYGNFGHHWNHIGARPWYSFLNEVSMEYAMTKLSDVSIHQFDQPKTMLDLYKRLIEWRRHGSLERFEARDAWEDITSLSGIDDEGSFVAELHCIELFQDDTYDYLRHEIKPSIRGFWDQLWRPWVMSVANTESLRNAA